MNKHSILLVTALFLLSVCACGSQKIKVNIIESDEIEKGSETDGITGSIQSGKSDQEEQESVRITEENERQEGEAPDVLPESDETFVLAADYIPNSLVDLKYAAEDNFTGTVIYEFDSAYVRYGTAKKLADVSEEIAKDGYALKIWDAYRPTAAQFKLWEVCPDSRYVANPNNGFSSHSRGNTVDITLITLDGNEVEMPTDFDDFSSRADRDYSDCSELEAQNARYLENVMTEHGFRPYQGEWWHYTDMDDYPVEEEFVPDS